jgi:hypothetical protein
MCEPIALPEPRIGNAATASKTPALAPGFFLGAR